MSNEVTTERAIADSSARHLLPLSGGKDSTALAVRHRAARILRQLLGQAVGPLI